MEYETNFTSILENQGFTLDVMKKIFMQEFDATKTTMLADMSVIPMDIDTVCNGSLRFGDVARGYQLQDTDKNFYLFCGIDKWPSSITIGVSHENNFYGLYEGFSDIYQNPVCTSRYMLMGNTEDIFRNIPAIYRVEYTDTDLKQLSHDEQLIMDELLDGIHSFQKCFLDTEMIVQDKEDINLRSKKKRIHKS